ncbi:MAG TPA: M1 family metallopeptidase [Steroidobacteraceae bacterium]|jgi:aminopeptidase N|nr:M1 family metallopeptidase [Steroidobacteraceae bacterium]
MKSAHIVALGAVLLLFGACTPKSPPAASAVLPSPRAIAPVLLTPEARDIHSYAQPAIARVTHVDLDLTADFVAHRFAGTASLDIDAQPDAAQVVLDTRLLDIAAVTDAQGKPLEWSLGENDAILGAPLTVQLKGARRLVIRYTTRPEAPALQWLKPEQTAGRQHPYLFSQGQAVLTRSWVPTQDSPGLRQTWSARIVAPVGLRVVMSAEMLNATGDPVADGPAAGGLAWRFRMEQPVPPYLISVAIGDIAFQSLGPRTGVYAEPSMLQRAAAEFVDLEQMVKTAESIYGPYRWGRYDLLILPPSFPFGGMENPRLTFATPTVIAGDRSLVSLVAHELAHSWSGNLVTNATWADFWLNEGFTVYYENRIMERLYSKERADMLRDIEWDELHEDFADFGGADSPKTRLYQPLVGGDPDDLVTHIAYNKGALFLRTIEAAVGRERLDTFLRAYFDRHAFQAQTTAGFLAELRADLIRDDAALEKSLALDAWAYGTGLPANAVYSRSEAFAKIDALAAAFAKRGPQAVSSPQDWSSDQRVRFLNHLPRKLSKPRLVEVQQFLNLAAQGNSEVLFAWLRLAVANRYEPALPQLETFLTSMGRRKFVLPLFTDLMGQGSWGRPIARRIYAIARPGYHYVTTNSVDKIVQPGT